MITNQTRIAWIKYKDGATILIYMMMLYCVCQLFDMDNYM